MASELLAAVMLVFYVFLLVRWQYVKRPLFFLLGAAGLIFAMIGGVFPVSVAWLSGIFQTIGVIVAFVAAVGACYGAELPVKLPASFTQGQVPPATPAPASAPAPAPAATK